MQSTLSLLKELLEKKEQGKIPPIVAMMIFSAILETLGVTLIVPVVSLVMQPDVIETNAALKAFCNVLKISDVKQLTIILMVALIILFVGKNAFLLLQYYVQAKFSYDNLYHTQKKLVHIFLNKPYTYYLGINTSDVVRLISQDSVGAFAVLQTAMEMGAEIIVAVTLVIAVFLMDPGMAIGMGLLLLIIMFVIAKSIKPKLKTYGASHVKYDTLATKWLMQFVSGIKDIKIAESESYFEEQYAYNDKIDKRMEKERTVYRNVPRVLLEATCIAGVLLIFIIRLLNGNDIASMIPQLSAFVVAAVRLLPSANRISAYVNEIAYNTPQLVRTVEHIREAKKQETDRTVIQEKICNADIMPLNDKIELKDVYYKYPDGDKYILENASMEIPVGKSVGVVGTSGAGKTTAIDILLGLHIPERGKVLVDGVDIQENYHGWLKNISYIPQTIYLLDGTIRENVIFGNVQEELGDSAVWEAIREAQLEEFIRSLPDGLDTQIGERGVRLSGGQRQRIGIARALYTNPSLLVLDEATSALDNATEESLMEAINSLHGKKTMIIIAHRLQTIENCDIVYNVGGGKITKEVKHES